MTSRDWLYILHANLDAFYTSVEQLDNPRYRGQPLVVGGTPEDCGVVAAASYEARKYGVRSAMPMRTALRLCPKLVRVPTRFGRYNEMSRQVMGIFLELTPPVEPMSLDEAYLDVTAESTWDGVAQMADDLKTRVKSETGLVLSIRGRHLQDSGQGLLSSR
jgi:DNA polymerase-4